MNFQSCLKLAHIYGNVSVLKPKTEFLVVIMSLEIFVIFHKRVYPEMYEELDEEEKACLTFVAVNENIEKDVLPEKYIKEWELPVYNPDWQKNNWMNGGTNHHIVMNKVSKADYIGFVQYDMRFPKGSIHRLKSMLSPNIGVSVKVMDLYTLLATSTYGFHEVELFNYTLSQLPQIKSMHFPLYHNCFMLREKYEEIMPVVLKIDETLYTFHNKPGDPIYRFPITTERTLALGIASVVDDVVELTGISHEKLIHLGTN